MRRLSRIAGFVAGLLIASAAFAQAPPTTKPNLSNAVAQCLLNVPLVGNGGGASPGCHASGALGSLAFLNSISVLNGVNYPASYTSGGIPYASATGTIASSAALAAGLMVQGGGAGVAPSTFTLGGDCTFSTPNVTCPKTGGTPFVRSATVLPQIQVNFATFTTSANSSTSTVYKYQLVGAGGGGGGSNAAANAGGGGGAGAFCQGTFSGVAASTSITITLGSGGAAGSSAGGAGGTGGSSTIAATGISTITASGGGGGGGGVANGGAAGGTGGACTNATSSISGAAGYISSGISASPIGGNGASTAFGNGGQGGGANIGLNGANATSPGAGGGGAITTTSTGGLGGTGYAMIEYVLAP